MIVKMEKLTLFIAEPNRVHAMKGLRQMGAVHLKSLRHETAVTLDSQEGDIDQTQEAIDIIKQYQHKNKRADKYKAHLNVQDKAKEIVGLYAELQSCRQDIEKIKQELEWFSPWGGFTPGDIQELAAHNIYIKLYKLNAAEYRQIADKDTIHIVQQDKQYRYIAYFARDKEDNLISQPVQLPTVSFKELCAQHESLEKRIGELNADLGADINTLPYLQDHLAALQKKYHFVQAVQGMHQENGFAYLQGYIPHDKTEDLAQLAESYNAGYFLETPDDPDDVPTYICNPKWVDIISPVFKFMSTVPGYAEYDISAWFLLFFSVFFAMLIGDAGYGIIFLVFTLILHRRFRHVPAQPFFLMYILSAATIIWGVVTGTWFGSKEIAALPFLSPLIIQSISSFAQDNQNLMIYICFTIGIIHLTIAHLIVGLRIFNSLKVLSEIGWILVLWALYFLAGMLVIGRPMPHFTMGLLWAGAILLLCFSEPQKNPLKAIASSLTNIPLKIVSSFADIVSYLRLFAVGCATVVLASTFNDIVIGIGCNSLIGGLAAAIILLLGHGLNIVLGFMAVIVHGIRLNMLEFSGQMGMGWSGKEYAPFKE
jgi:V/A-type H+/Na+-transporting ATPase subunit I